jgi:ABC-type transport system involved in cytochrome bd biosynthesis fused ATPase/permease subunit
MSLAISGAVGLLVGCMIDITFGVVIALMLAAVLPVFFIKVMPKLVDQTDKQTNTSAQPKTNALKQKTLNNALGMARKLRHDLETKLNKDQNATQLQEELQRIKEREEMIIKELDALNKRKKSKPPR